MRLANDRDTIAAMQGDSALMEARKAVYSAMARYRYAYNFTWQGVPIIQLPEDILAMQEIILSVKPELIIETGVAHGGSLLLSASLLELLGRGEVLGVEIDIRDANRRAIESHPMAGRIALIEGSSVDEAVAREVHRRAAGKSPVMVFLDSNHTHAHVLEELRLYSPLVTRGSYLVVFDTGIEDVEEPHAYPDRPWGKGNNPKTAVREFLAANPRFEVDTALEQRLLFSAAPEGYLKCVQ
jgi:cephalosporin hydroxylase